MLEVCCPPWAQSRLLCLMSSPVGVRFLLKDHTDWMMSNLMPFAFSSSTTVNGTNFQCSRLVKSSTSLSMASLNLCQSGCRRASLRCMVSGSPVAAVLAKAWMSGWIPRSVPSGEVVEIPIRVKCALTNTGCGAWDANLTDLLLLGSRCDPIPSLVGCVLLLVRLPLLG